MKLSVAKVCACVDAMVISRLSVLVSGFGVGFGLVHTTLVVVSGCFEMFQDVSGSAANDHGARAKGASMIAGAGG